jgi:hypothetical protein
MKAFNICPGVLLTIWAVPSLQRVSLGLKMLSGGRRVHSHPS